MTFLSYFNSTNVEFLIALADDQLSVVNKLVYVHVIAHNGIEPNRGPHQGPIKKRNRK